jgi:hypothetical protein
LGLKEDDPKTLKVPPNLPVGQRKQVTLLVALDQLFVLWDTAELDRASDAEFGDETLQIGPLPPLPGDDVEQRWELFEESWKRSDHVVLALPLLQRSDRQNHGPTLPAEPLPDGSIWWRRHKFASINARVEDVNPFGRDSPVASEKSPSMFTVRNDASSTM